MVFTEEELQLIETSLRSLLDRRGGVDKDIEELIEKITKMNIKDLNFNMRVINILTEKELQEVRHLKKGIMRSSTNAEIRYYRREIDQVIKKAKERYCNS